jgi:cis-L-3-hydroxyproline dehydratase
MQSVAAGHPARIGLRSRAMTLSNPVGNVVQEVLGTAARSPIVKVDLFSYDLTYVGGEYVMSGDRVISSLASTVARVETEDGFVGFGETCPLGSNYLPAHAAGARAALEEVAPHVLGLDACNPAAVSRAMDARLQGHGYISLDTPERMVEQVQSLRATGTHRFQLKLGNDPVEDAARARAVVEATSSEDVVFGDANCGWSLAGAITAARLMESLPRFYLEQPCRTFEECLRVREHTSLPMILDELIVDLQDLLRAWEARCLEGFNLKINRVGGLTQARLLRDVGQELGLIVNIEDSWGGDLTTAAVSHLAASSPAETAWMISFMNDWTREHIAGYVPRSHDGIGAAPPGPGLGVEVDLSSLTPIASFSR